MLITLIWNIDNALAGKTLALNPPGLEEDKQTKAGPTRISENGQMVESRPPLPGLWADLYSTWNMAYITRWNDVGLISKWLSILKLREQMSFGLNIISYKYLRVDFGVSITV